MVDPAGEKGTGIRGPRMRHTAAVTKTRFPATLAAFSLLLALFATPPTTAQAQPGSNGYQLDADDRPTARAAPGDGLGLVADGIDITARVDVPAPRTDLSPRELLAWRSADALDGEVVTGEITDLRVLASTYPGVRLSRVVELKELTVSEGNAVVGASQWQSAGLSGEGVRIAIVDSSFDGYQALLGSGLPASVTVRSLRADGSMESGSQHGTAVAEIVYDLAPQATMFLVAAEFLDDLDPVVDYLIAQGVDVVNMSLGSTVGPFGSQSSAAVAVQRAVDAGIVWVNAAGNSADLHWGGNFVDTDFDGWAEISGTQEMNTFMVSGGGLVFIDLAWVNSSVDLDLCLYDTFGAELGCSAAVQGPGVPPVESVVWFNDSFFPRDYGYAVGRFSGVSTYYDVFVDGDIYDLDQVKAEGSMLTPGDAPGAIAVGASSWMAPTNVVEYSSRGPTVDGFTKPDLIAPTDVSTIAFGPSSFAGTSSASPHVAGLVALYLQANPGANPSEVKQALVARAAALGYGTLPNNTEGWGLAQTGSVPHGAPGDWSDELVGDFDGDGSDDVAAYNDTSGMWWVHLSAGSEFDPQTWVTFMTKTGWGPQLVGDFNGDGMDDIASFRSSDGTWWVSISTGTGFVTTLWADFSTASGWNPQVVGDFNGDGRDDIADFHPSNGTWWVSVSTGSGFVTTLWADFSTASGWGPQVVGDFTGDGKDDVANYHPGNGTWWVSVSTGSGFVTSLWADFSTASGWGPQVVGDFTGDGKDDVASFSSSDGTWWVSVSDGMGFATGLWADFSTAAGWGPQLVGDFNGDGKADVANFHDSNGTWWVSVSDGMGFATGLWADFSTAAGWSPQVVGNLTGDGKADIANFHHSNGTWWVSASNGTNFTTTLWYQ